MSDMIGTQIVGFLKHRINYCWAERNSALIIVAVYFGFNFEFVLFLFVSVVIYIVQIYKI